MSNSKNNSKEKKNKGKIEIKKEAKDLEFKNDKNKVFYGDSSKVNSVNNYDYNDHLKRPKSSQNLEGFDDQYNDFVDYILKITHNIWEEKGIGIIYDTYHNNVLMHAGSNNITGIQAVISGTLQTLHSFPDRRLIGQEVIWSEHEDNSYLSSHRIMSTATNLGDSNFAKATGKKVNFRTTVDCLAKNNRIYEEWLVRDNLWIVKQLGLDPDQVAKKMAKKEINNDLIQRDFGIDEAMDGQFFPEKYSSKDDSIGEFMKEMLNQIYQCKLINKVKDYYADNAVVHYICDKDLIGYDQIQGMLISLFASFPNAKFSVDRITCNQAEKKNSWNVAVRWRLSGLHNGRGYFGEPSGQAVEILGISHYHILDSEVVEEWITFDGLDVLKQIAVKNLEDSQETEKKEME